MQKLVIVDTPAGVIIPALFILPLSSEEDAYSMLLEVIHAVCICFSSGCFHIFSFTLPYGLREGCKGGARRCKGLACDSSKLMS